MLSERAPAPRRSAPARPRGGAHIRASARRPARAMLICWIRQAGGATASGWRISRPSARRAVERRGGPGVAVEAEHEAAVARERHLAAVQRQRHRPRPARCRAAARPGRRCRSRRNGGRRLLGGRAEQQQRRGQGRQLRQPTTRTAARSASVSSGFQTSRMRIARGASLSFQASCSIVSSNAQALPASRVRVSAPTRNPHPSGTTSGRWTVVRTLLEPVWRRNPRARLEDREHRRRPLAGQVEQGQRLQRGGGRRAAGAILVLPHAVLPEEPGAPARASD